MASRNPLTDNRANAVVNFALVGGAGAAARYAVNPLSVCKIWSEAGVPGGKMGPTAAAAHVRRLYGYKGFLTGAGASALRTLPHYGIAVTVFDRLAGAFVPATPKANVWPSLETMAYTFVCGSVSGVAATLATHPLDVVKVRLVTQASICAAPGATPHYKNATDAFFKILYDEGFYRGVYRGLALSMCGSAIFAGYTLSLLSLLTHYPHKNKPFIYFENAAAGAAVVSVGVVAAHPFDVLRRKYMAQSYLLPKDGGVDVKFRSLWDCVRGIYLVSGPWGYFHGLFSNVLKVGPQVGVFWLALTAGRRLLHSGDAIPAHI